MLKHLFQPLLDWYQTALESGGYWIVGLLMTAESSVLPLPSESIIPLAASWSHSLPEKYHMSIPGIVIAGALGSWLGATIVYWLARMAGRPLLMRYGRYVLITPEKIQKSENWMSHYGAAGVFIARLLPGARQLVGIPAGIARMNYLTFSIFTLIGSAIWCSVLCYVGIKAGQDEKLMHGDLQRIALWLGLAMLALGGLYYLFVHRHMAAGKAKSGKRKAE
jgi:membrane protein DedA with SNARE-associated domain